MSRLTLEERRTRLALDYRAMRSLRGSALGRVEAFVSPLDLGSRREATEAEGLSGLVTAYRVEFTFPMLRAPGRELHQARAIFRVPALDYPFTEPTVEFETRAIPFSPHIGSSGQVCLGEAWELAGGHWLLANLVIHVMKVVNFDEPCTKDGFSAAAVRHAREVLRGRPLNPDLDYPVVDEDVTHSGGRMLVVPSPSPAPLFRPSSGFTPRTRIVPPIESGFRRRSL